jgi:diguanylate cyclase (GGDEF)-like protein
MAEFIAHAAAITRHREHALVNSALLHSLVDLFASDRKRFQARLFTIHALSGGRYELTLTAWNEDRTVHCGEQECVHDSLPPQLFQAIESQVMVAAVPERRTDWHHCWLPAIYDRVPLACLEIQSQRPLAQRQMATIGGIIALYTNYLSLLTYSQVDTLTQLLNRKTFDDSLDKILGHREHAAQQPADQERRAEAGTSANDDWLAVIDIDHFKQVNDRFGHLFGDEMLILLADTMRRSFRRRDKLFRFGGEEFVVILRHTNEHRAQQVFERFRLAVMEREFPQLGHMTVSVGYTRIRAFDTPSNLIGRADEALYYAKRHGRNQLRCYEVLAQAGHVVERVMNTEAELF